MKNGQKVLDLPNNTKHLNVRYQFQLRNYAGDRGK